MSRSDDDAWSAPPKAEPVHIIGEPLDALSLAEIDRRVAALEGEIRRLQAKRAEKDASRIAADSFFRK